MDAGGRATQEQLPDAGANDGVGPKGTRQEPRVIQFFCNPLKSWIPAFAGMTSKDLFRPSLVFRLYFDCRTVLPRRSPC
jgi:hypothetical protein